VTFEKASGSALCTDIESTVRAVGRIVVWVDDDAEARPSATRGVEDRAKVEWPKIAGPRMTARRWV